MIKLYTDGGSRGNPGNAAYGFLIFDEGKKLHEEGKYIGKTTNNVAEYTAIIEGLKKAKDFGGELSVFSDSELVVRQLKGEYKVKKSHLKDLHCKVLRLEKEFDSVTYTHRRREDPMQREADRLVNEALDLKS